MVGRPYKKQERKGTGPRFNKQKYQLFSSDELED
jgi:hypothetical protein